MRYWDYVYPRKETLKYYSFVDNRNFHQTSLQWFLDIDATILPPMHFLQSFFKNKTWFGKYSLRFRMYGSTYPI